MANATLTKLKKNTAKWGFFVEYVKSKKFAKQVSFLMAQPPKDDLYHTFFSKTPVVKLEGIQSFAKKAQQTYLDRLDQAAEAGMKASEGDRHACNSPIYGKIMDAYISHITDVLENKIMPGFVKSGFYERYVETQVCGSSLAGQMKFPASAADDLQNVKVSLILGNKSNALSAAKRVDQTDPKRNKRHAVKFLSPKEIVAQVDKIKIAV